ncbi:MAG: DNA mismatch repair protein MutS, partial [Lachnospiraceae bacterium]|nr:DNA mismatch repair protein MutS [Lachnospiraceae bacterium]
IDGVKNYCISVKEQGDNIIFLRKIIRGGADKSYGIQVASLAGVPAEITKRAKEIVNQLITADITMKKPELLQNIEINDTDDTAQEIISKIRNIDVDRLTPLDALNILYELKRETNE